MGRPGIRELSIDGARLYQSLSELGKVGAFDDEPSGLVGVRRLALTDEDKAGRELVISWFEAAGLTITVDRIGNVYGRRAGDRDDLAPVLCGSHIDSVPTAGRFDGCLGVLGGLEVIRTLNDRGIATKRPLMVGFFTDEEGVRFDTDLLGSSVAAGRVSVEEAYAVADRDGVTLGEELDRIGFKGSVDPTSIRPHGYLECHIEQGPVLIQNGFDVGIVTGVQAITWHRLTVKGRAAHAGTTPIEYRKDAGLAAARINVKLREMVLSGKYGDAMRATMGVIRGYPAAYNVVPAQLLTSVDMRNPSAEAIHAAEEELIAFYSEVEARDGVEVVWEPTARTPPVPFDDGIQSMLSGFASELELRHHTMLSGAGHDAQEWARVCKTGMVFVPGEHDGISHNPREYSSEQQCANGINVMLHGLLALADED